MTTKTKRAASNLTGEQQLLWAAQQMNPAAPIYNMAFAFEIDTEVDVNVFRNAFEQLISECDALRTVVETRDGTPTQKVLPSIDFEPMLIDLSDEDDPSATFRSWATNRCASPLPIERRMFDTALARLGRDRSGWYLSQHHIVSDASSFSLLFERMEHIYTALRHGRPVPENPLAPYAAYVDHERQIRTDAEVEDNSTPLPADPPLLYGLNPPHTGSGSERMTCELGETRSQRLRALAEQPDLQSLTTDLSLFRLFLTAIFVHLYRISGQESITIGAPAHNRVTQAFRRTVGLFTEVYPLNVTIDEEETFQSLHDKVRDASDVFLRSVRPGGSSAEANRAVNTVLNYIPSRFGMFDGSAVVPEWIHSGHVEPEHHLRLHVTDWTATGDFTLLFDCNRDVLDGDQRQRVVEHFLGVLDSMLADWTRPISTIELLTATERLQLRAYNNTSSDKGADETVVGLFERRVAEAPDSLALIGDDATWTYDELDRATRRLARRIEPGSVVGIGLPRSSDAVIAMLGSLRAGAAYVPIDPAWPRDRIDFVIDDSGCSTVIADEQISTDVPATPLQTLLDGVDIAKPREIKTQDLAYILYTSGSTGRPKGVMIEHGSLANYATWAADFYDRGRRLTFPLFSPLTFDLTVTSIFVPLISGGTIVVYPETSGTVDLAVQKVFDDDLVDIVKLTPSHLAIVSDRDLSASRIGELILGGEEMTTAAANRIIGAFGGSIMVHNEYGPTEATVGCVVHTFDADRDREPTVPIGRPVANMRAHVLNTAAVPVPIGVPGELWLAGAGLARGYLNRPELTAERFVDGSGVGEERLYETGDRARLRADGTLEYLGRRDDQVKVRGARVELGEVEAAVASHPEVTASAATVHRPVAATPWTDLTFCSRCGLPSNYPNISFSDEGVCNDCQRYDLYAKQARVYFKPMVELEAVFAASREQDAADYDCISLLSGGKDSTYTLCRLVDMGLNVLAFTLDNGYISEEAKTNILRVCDTLGVDHVFGSTPAMNEIFVDSLQRHSNVCNGCFKTIYTLSLQVAREKGIPLIVTGLSRGQFFETRLTADLFTELTVSSDQIDARVLEARKAYHQVDDAPCRLLDQSVFEGDRIFEEVQFVDFYRYCDVDLDEIMMYLESRVPWIRPSDTGRSTNCLINDVGIYVHKKVRGFHNYALPYSWDVRLGHKTRAQALNELDDEIDVRAVQRILDEIGYPEDVTTLQSDSRLVAYYVGTRDLTASELRGHLQQTLPDAMIPSQFVRLDTIPLTANGKVDRGALPQPGASRPSIDTAFVGARTETEIKLAEIWRNVLGIEDVGIRDNFFDLGGDSIMAIQIVARARRAGIATTLSQLFESLTVEDLASSCPADNEGSEQRLVEVVDVTTGTPGIRTAIDFPHANLDDDGLAKLALLLDQTEGGGR